MDSSKMFPALLLFFFVTMTSCFYSHGAAMDSVNKVNQICPDHTQCNGTCCKVAGGYGCCPLEHGVCCADQKHCCPAGSVCDPSTASCRKREESGNGFIYVESGLQELQLKTGRAFNRQNQPQFTKLMMLLRKPNSNEICPDGYPCDGTCCPMEQGWGCCPMDSATCCPDKVHCCPEGSTCAGGTCLHQEKVTNNLINVKSKLDVPIVHFLKESKQICPDGSPCNGTCCKVGLQHFGCCPLARAVCCSDQKHCCPANTVCDEATESCIHREDSSDSLIIYESGMHELKMDSSQVKKVNQICPDHTQCTGTCCKVAGGYGCCPLEHGVCCDDQKHCCPAGSVCDPSTASCRKREESGNGFIYIESGLQELQLKTDSNEICPDHSQCPGGTCCIMPNGEYGCCPRVNAVCCADKEHCCPHNTRCNLVNATCDPAETGVAILKISNPEPRPEENSVYDTNNIVCPDGGECPDSSTCCLVSSSQYGCCPYPTAVCCGDYSHCCPAGYTCDLPRQRCISSNGSKTKLKKIQVQTLSPAADLLNPVNWKRGNY